ncbi:type II secretion system F family protein [Lacticaseibacillus absianus]|uniref:type II secretion system F family protein n=1 Tax=Lacticaseibacillus absianus TaxID=2729623 RepID=UPI0015CC3BED|nr:type II secretion system F family protein [Lacticaseibacillus absianus]
MHRRARQPALKVQLAACERLISLLTVGFTLSEGLAYLVVSMPQQAGVWQQLTAALAAGESLEVALTVARFHPVIVTQVRLAAIHGQLVQGLAVAVRFLTLQRNSWQRLRQLLVYPAVLLALLAGLQVVLWVNVLPALGQPPKPPLTQLLVLTAVGLAVSSGWWFWRRLTPLARGRLLLRLPGVRRLAKSVYQFQFVSGAAQFLAVGLPVTAYLAQLAQLPPSVLTQLGRELQAKVAAGQALEAALHHPLVYAPARELLGLGQTAALVATGMQLLATQLMAQLQTRSERWLAVVQPLMFLLIGGQIVWVYQSLLGPLYSGGGWL